MELYFKMREIEISKEMTDKIKNRFNSYWNKIAEAFNIYCTKNNISYEQAQNAMNSLIYIFQGKLWTLNYFSDGQHLYLLNNCNQSYSFIKITEPNFFDILQIQYKKSEETSTIYFFICRALKYTCNINTRNLKSKLQSGDYNTANALLFYALFKYYLSCHIDGYFSIPNFFSSPIGNFYIENENLIFCNKQNEEFITLTQEMFYNYLEYNNYPIPYNKKTLYDVFLCIKLLVQNIPLPVPAEQSCVMQFESDNIQYYKYIYNKEIRKMQLYHFTARIRSNNYVPIHSNRKPTLTANLINYFSKLVCNNRNSLVTLAKLVAAIYSTNQPLNKLTYVEITKNEKNNLCSFLSNFCHAQVFQHTLSELCEIRNIFDKPVYNKILNCVEYQPAIYFANEESLSKLTKHKLSIIKTIITGNTLYYKDAIFGTLHANNYIPIIYLSENLEHYSFLNKHFNCSILKINPTEMEIPRFTDSEREWFYRIFLPYGREILSNGHNNILRYQPKQKSIPISSIECFMNNFTMYSDNNHIYPEELYASYKQFSEHGNPNSQICKKAVFIKLVRSLKAYNYTRIHIRQTKEHDASNRYGFKNLTINTERLNQYLSNTDDASIEQKDLRNELEAITEHYKDLFDTAIPEPPAEPVTVNLS